MIGARIIADSVSSAGKRLTTFELEYPRFILAELNTHRMISRNTASSRAIPNKRFVELIEKNTAMPVYWGSNQSGMQAGEEIEDILQAKIVWLEAAKSALEKSQELAALGLHKETVNRVHEPFQVVKTVVSGTEWSNFFWLRNHEDAQPEFRELASTMYYLYTTNEPKLLRENEWHLPYYNDGKWSPHSYEELSLEDAIKVSVSCCAQVSYRRLDDSLERANRIYDLLNLDGDGEDRKHSSPSEHQGKPIYVPEGMSELEALQNIDGITSLHKYLGLMSGNFSGWVQYRQLIENNTRW